MKSDKTKIAVMLDENDIRDVLLQGFYECDHSTKSNILEAFKLTQIPQPPDAKAIETLRCYMDTHGGEAIATWIEYVIAKGNDEGGDS